MIRLRRGENPRYTIFRATNPDEGLYLMTPWISAEWVAWRIERGLPRNHRPDAIQHEDFNIWLAGRYGATYEDGYELTN